MERMVVNRFTLGDHNTRYRRKARCLAIALILFVSSSLSPPAKAACTVQAADADAGTPKTLTCNTEDPNPAGA